MIKAVIFDIGGALAHDVWEHLLLDKETGVAAAYKLNPELVKAIARELWDQYAYVKHSESWQELEAEYWTRFSHLVGVSLDVGDVIERTKDFIKPVDGMTDLLRDLKAKPVGLAICSDNTEFWYRKQADRINLSEYIPDERVILSCRVGKSKSSPCFEMFSEVVKKLGIEKEECVFVDDNWEKVLNALNYGLTGIVFPKESPCGARYLTALFERMNLL